ncbi:MAG: DUF374 domain-containing protein [Opitutaceae bacterium]
MADSPEQGVDTTVYQPKGLRRALLWCVSVLYRVWAATIRVEIDARSLACATYHEEPVVIIMWHSTLFMAPIAYKRFRTKRPVFALISASRDGGELAYFFGKIGIGAVRGSSSRFGREAFGNLVRCSLEGNDITVTPDGPRGPAYVMKGGVVLAARRTRHRVLLSGMTFGRSFRLKSWDRFVVPLPFSKVKMETELIDLDSVPAGAEGVAYLQERLNRLTGERIDRASADHASGPEATREHARSSGSG